MTYSLITGGLGLIGTFIAREILDRNITDEVVCLDNFSHYVSPFQSRFVDYRSHRLDLLNHRAIVQRVETRYRTVIEDMVSRYEPLLIFHLAALPLARPDNLSVQEALEGSVESTCALIDAVNTVKRRTEYCPDRFIYASSSMVYGDFMTSSVTEDDPTRPQNIYGTMKLAGESVTHGLCNHYGIPYSIIRPSAVYGPTDMNRRVVQTFLESALNNQPITIHGPDEALDFTYVRDIAHGFVQSAIEPRGNNETFNITFGKARTLLELVECLTKYFPNLTYDIAPRDSTRPRRGTLNIDKARRLVDYAPSYTLEKGIEEYVDFYRRLNKQ